VNVHLKQRFDARQRADQIEREQLNRDAESVHNTDAGLPDYVSKWIAQQKAAEQALKETNR